MCPGLNMGVHTVELTLANLVQSFEWKLLNGFDKDQVLDTQVKPGIVMHKKNDLYLVPRKRIPWSFVLLALCSGMCLLQSFYYLLDELLWFQ
jgi:hypothetical protein